MLCHLRLLLVLLPALASFTFAQRLGRLEAGDGVLRVHVVSTNDRPLGESMRVRLMGIGGAATMAEGYTDSTGEVNFNGVTPGTYHVLVSGEGYEDADSGNLDIDARKMTQTVFVRVRPSKKQGDVVTNGKQPTVDVSLLKAPKEALKEFEKGNQLLGQKQWAKAVEHLKKAVAIYPEFGAAYNNLAVAYAKLGDRDREREALDQALKWNDHNAPALLNRAHVAITDKNLPLAEDLLSRATSIDPGNPQTLMVLAKIQLLNQHYEAALASAQRLHAQPHQGYAMVHYVAARAFEATNHRGDAASQLRIFLQEQPNGEWADAARKEIALLEGGGGPALATAADE